MTAFLFQNCDYDCAIHAVLNACNVLGVETDYDTVKALTGIKTAKMRKDGVSERGIIRALRGLGLHYAEYTTHDPENGWRWLLHWSNRTPTIVCLDGNGHWGVVSGRVGNKVILVDSIARLKRGENGVHPLSKSQVLERWMFRVCYGIRAGIR